MIKIVPYYEHKNRDQIINLYLNMIAYVMPFYPEDVFPEGKFRWKETWVDSGQFASVTGKHTRSRKNNYLSILRKYGIKERGNENRKKRAENDALLAKRIIHRNSEKLYEFLYKGIGEECVHVNSENLYELLTIPMNKLHTAHHNLNFKITDPDKELLSHVFRYDVFASKKEEISELLELLGVEVCPYCNRIFITTLGKKENSLRAQIDHYKSKSKYPHLALSIMNMIPACGQCNYIKSDKDIPVLYPYAEEMGDSWVFETQPQGSIMYLTGNQTEKDKFIIAGKRQNEQEKGYMKRLKNSLEVFKLEDLYNSHKEYVLDLYRQRYFFGEDYLQSLCDSFPELFHDLADVKNMLYLSDIRKENWGKRPLSKLTHDIDEEILRLGKRMHSPEKNL